MTAVARLVGDGELGVVGLRPFTRGGEVPASLERQLSTSEARDVAQTYACLGDAERSLEYLEKAFLADEPNLPEIVQSPELQWMRTNPRFALLRKKLKLSP